MFWKSMQWVAIAVVLVGGLSLGGGLWAVRPGVAQEEAPRPPAVAKADEPAAKAKAEQPDDPVEEAARRSLTRRNLRTLAEALRKYDVAVGHLPQPATADKAGKLLLSWRVALLPYLGEDGLYKQFKQDEPWDSPHNKKLLAKMPGIFAPVGVKSPQKNSTFYQVFVGPGATYRSYHLPKDELVSRPGSRPGTMTMGAPSLNGVLDSRSANTILIVEAGSPVPWSKPEDIPSDFRKPLPALGGQFANVFHAVFGDGTVRTISKTKFQAKHPQGIRRLGHGIDWAGFNRPDESPVRQKVLDELGDKNVNLKEDAAILKGVLDEIKTEIKNLRWTLEQQKMRATDPAAMRLEAENKALEKAIKEGRDEARKLMQELRKVKEEMKKK